MKMTFSINFFRRQTDVGNSVSGKDCDNADEEDI